VSNPALQVAPELADPLGSVEVREHQDVEQLGALEPARMAAVVADDLARLQLFR
jgi:hypothetical protein